jgi:hypothetical protein
MSGFDLPVLTELKLVRTISIVFSILPFWKATNNINSTLSFNITKIYCFEFCILNFTINHQDSLTASFSINDFSAWISSRDADTNPLLKNSQQKHKIKIGYQITHHPIINSDWVDQHNKGTHPNSHPNMVHYLKTKSPFLCSKLQKQHSQISNNWKFVIYLLFFRIFLY